MTKTFLGISIAAFMAAFGVATSGPAAAAGPTCTDGKIVVGAVATETGPADFSEVTKAAKATFDKFNADGGVNGCKIEFVTADDKADPAVAAQAARDIVENKGAVVMTGSASLLECAINAGYYDKQGILSVHGLGVDPVCFNSPSISPVNVGPYTLTTAVLQYASSKLGAKKLCGIFWIVGGTDEAYKGSVARWEKISGQTFGMVDLTLPFQGDYTPYVLKARDEGCDAVVMNTVEPQIVQMVKTADAQNITGIKWMFLAPGYTVQVAKTLADSKQEIYVGTEWEPYTDAGSKANEGWNAAMTAAGLPLTAFTQGGYQSADILLSVIKSIDGPVTRETVTNALHNLQPISHPLVGTPYTFGKAASHASSQGTKMVKLVKGAWQVETPDWFILPTE
jgi:branched-chain amino acid transport system substrate-binding protein